MAERLVMVQVPAPWQKRIDALVAGAGWRAVGLNAFERLPHADQKNVHAGVFMPDDGRDAELSRIDALMASRTDVEWLALVRPEALSDPRLCHLLRNRCFDFHTLPIDPARFLTSLGHAEGKARLAAGPAAASEEVGRYGMIGRSPAMLDLYRGIRKASGVDAPVMLSGERGTGKELAARAIHQLSSRRDRPFVAVNCAALPPHPLQAGLFGPDAPGAADAGGAGSMETAAGGTLFLDEIGELPLAQQAALLRALQQPSPGRPGAEDGSRLDVRLIAASQAELEHAVAQGRFRADLYYRINVLRLRIPPLREREDDVALLARACLDRFRAESRGVARGFSQQAMTVMANYEWPGNVRELLNRVREAAVLSENRLLTPQDLGLEKRVPSEGFLTLEEARARAEHETIRHALRRNRNNVAAAARQLGVSRATLYRVLERVSHGDAASRTDPGHAPIGAQLD